MHSFIHSSSASPNLDLSLNLACYTEKTKTHTLSKTMKFNVTLDRDEDGVWIIECPSIPGCVSQGQTKEKALENIKDAIAACLQVRAELGLPLTIETHQVEVVA
ncbi:hypothetical protein NUACC26_043770 [Scytonema sp. NUACC26]